jgi:uncharacterized membrane protein
MMVLLGYFINAVMAAIAASAILGFILSNLLIARVQKLTGLSGFRHVKDSVSA